MPQSGRKDASNAHKNQERESKRARGALSCAECRRLKLKCDKIVPCSSCKRRGCSAICPNGSLITGQGTRFVLADTEKLHQKIAQMSDRIRQLEDALAIAQSTISKDPHPLLKRELLKIKSSLELHSAIEVGELESSLDAKEETDEALDAFGFMALHDDGATTFYGRSAGSESLLMNESVKAGGQPSLPPANEGTTMSGLPVGVLHVAAAFPFEPTYAAVTTEELVVHGLPAWDVAWMLCESYLSMSTWFFYAVTKQQLHEELLPMWYAEAAPLAPATPPDNHVTRMPSNGAATSHDLALLFMVLCFGSFTDLNLTAAGEGVDCERYYKLSKAALGLEPLLERVPSVATVQTLALMGIYEGLRGGDNSIEGTWLLMGLATKMAQSIGLHRDSARFQLQPSEVQKRRALFWELFITDSWQSLATGRLATFSLPFVDCELPADPDQTMAEDGTIQPSFPFWKARFGAECVSAVVQGTLISKAPKYSSILELDRKVRDMELPKYAQGEPPQGAGLLQTMSHFMPLNYRELTLLYIHRCFFAHALSTSPIDPISSPYAPSFLAGYRSACGLIASIKKQFTLFSEVSRMWVLWTHAFSSAVMISSVVTHSPRSKVAPAALLELNAAVDLFEKAAAVGGRAVKFLPIVRRMQREAQRAFMETNNGTRPAMIKDIFTPSNPAEEKDDLSVFSGKTHSVTTKRVRSGGPVAPETAQQQQQQSQSPQNTSHTNAAFSHAHPSLVHELSGFDGKITAQVENAYYSDQASFTHAIGGELRPPAENFQYHLSSSSVPMQSASYNISPTSSQHSDQFMQSSRMHETAEDRRPNAGSYSAPAEDTRAYYPQTSVPPHANVMANYDVQMQSGAGYNAAYSTSGDNFTSFPADARTAPQTSGHHPQPIVQHAQQSASTEMQCYSQEYASQPSAHWEGYSQSASHSEQVYYSPVDEAQRGFATSTSVQASRSAPHLPVVPSQPHIQHHRQQQSHQRQHQQYAPQQAPADLQYHQTNAYPQWDVNGYHGVQGEPHSMGQQQQYVVQQGTTQGPPVLYQPQEPRSYMYQQFQDNVAADPSLQETWQSYMISVGSPRQY